MRWLLDWKFWIGILLSGLFLFLAVRKVDVHGLMDILIHVRYLYLIPVVLLVIFSLWMRAVRWRFLLEPVKKVSMRSMFSATAIGFMANNIFPARLGEFVKAYAIDRKENVGKSASFATIVVERIFDGMTVLFFLCLVLIMWRVQLPGWISKITYGAITIYLLVLIVLVVLKVQTHRTLKLIQWIIRPFSEKLRHRIYQIFSSFVRGLDILHNSKNIFISIFLSLLVWLPHAVLIHLQLMAFDIHLSFYASLLLMVIICFGVMIPSAPGYLGTIQFLCVAGLAMFQIPREDALSFSILYHATQYIPITVIGLVYFFIEGFSFSQIKETSQTFDNSEL